MCPVCAALQATRERPPATLRQATLQGAIGLLAYISVRPDFEVCAEHLSEVCKSVVGIKAMLTVLRSES
jgi:hypothetical protein